jgi:hypothetical protein
MGALRCGDFEKHLGRSPSPIKLTQVNVVALARCSVSAAMAFSDLEIHWPIRGGIHHADGAS